MKIKYLLFALTLYMFLDSCSSKSRNKDNQNEKALQTVPDIGYSIVFFTLDNYAMVYVNDKLVLDTRDRSPSQNDEVLLDLNPFVTNSNAIIKVEGYNTECTNCQVNNYEFVYEIYRDGEGIEYISEYSNHKHQPSGLRMTKIHYLNEL